MHGPVAFGEEEAACWIPEIFRALMGAWEQQSCVSSCASVSFTCAGRDRTNDASTFKPPAVTRCAVSHSVCLLSVSGWQRCGQHSFRSDATLPRCTPLFDFAVRSAACLDDHGVPLLTLEDFGYRCKTSPAVAPEELERSLLPTSVTAVIRTRVQREHVFSVIVAGRKSTREYSCVFQDLVGFSSKLIHEVKSWREWSWHIFFFHF